MSQPWTSPPELAKYTVSPLMATEFSIDSSRPTAANSSSSQPGAWNTTCGSAVTSPSSPYPRLSLMMWNREFSPPMNR